MVLKFVTIGSMVNVHVYEDGTHPYGFETDGVAYVGEAPTNPNEVLRLTDLPTLGNIITSTAIIADHAIVRGDGGARGIQESIPTITDGGSILLPNGARATPAIGFTSNPDVGFHYSPGGGGTIYATINDANVFEINGDDVFSHIWFRVKTGTVGALSITFGNDVNTGFYSPGDDELGLATHGVLRVHVTDTETRLGGAANYASFLADGELRLFGTAKVLRSVDIDVTVAKRPAVNPAGEGTEDGFPTLDFDDGTEESILIETHLPHAYESGSDVQLHIDFFVDVAPVGAANAGWGVEYKKVSHGDIFTFTGTSTVEAATVITTGTPANDKKVHKSDALSFTTAGWVPGDTIYCRLYRNVGVANDFTGDIRVQGEIHFEYLSDRLGQAT